MVSLHTKCRNKNSKSDAYCKALVRHWPSNVANILLQVKFTFSCARCFIFKIFVIRVIAIIIIGPTAFGDRARSQCVSSGFTFLCLCQLAVQSLLFHLQALLFLFFLFLRTKGLSSCCSFFLLS